VQPTTDYGIDLLIFYTTQQLDSKAYRAVYLHVKTSTKIETSDSKWLSWSIPNANAFKTQHVAVVDVERNKLGLCSKDECEKLDNGKGD
jgi:hypothetical protein